MVGLPGDEAGQDNFGVVGEKPVGVGGQVLGGLLPDRDGDPLLDLTRHGFGGELGEDLLADRFNAPCASRSQ